ACPMRGSCTMTSASYRARALRSARPATSSRSSSSTCSPRRWPQPRPTPPRAASRSRPTFAAWSPHRSMIAVGFDFDHTLGVDNGLEREALYAYAHELGRPLDPGDAAWRTRVEDLLATFRA